MKEYPILFKGEMVRAIMEGRKTQTRRIIKPQPHPMRPLENITGSRHWIDTAANSFVCKQGTVGDRLWVRETWRAGCVDGDAFYKGIAYQASYDDDANWFRCLEDERELWAKIKDEWHDLWDKYGDACRPSIFMPRWASRITLEVTGVRVERLQEISEEDARAEGAVVGQYYEGATECPLTHKFAFYQLWESINAKRGYGWDVNPWCWVVEFRRVEA